jgi:hypothetical protein
MKKLIFILTGLILTSFLNAQSLEDIIQKYTETNGVVLPMKTSVSVMGMDMVTTFSKVEVDIPIEDSVFKLK